MPYLGNTPTTQSFISGTDYFNGTGSQTAFTLTRTVASVNDIQAVVNNVVQVPNDAYTLSGTTITFTSAPSAGTQNVYVRYLSTTTQAITPSQGTVSWNTLDSNIQQDLGLMYKNKIINGNMVISQRNGTSSVTPTTFAYTLDRWYADMTQASKFSVQQDAGAVTPPVGFIDYLGVTSLAATTVGAGDFYTIGQVIEGFNISDLGWGTVNAKTVTISFWVRSSLTGTFGGVINNSGGSRAYPFTYTINSANTWEYETITIAGDQSGTWLTNNGAGIELKFSLGVGSTYAGTAGAWGSTNRFGATGQVNMIATNGATFYLTGVQLEVGTQATTFTTAGGSYGAELALCQRYFQTYTQPPLRGVINTTSSLGRAAMVLPVVMRAVPTVVAGALPVFDGTAVSTTSSIAAYYATGSQVEFDFALASAVMTIGRPGVVYQFGSASLTLSAEL